MVQRSQRLHPSVEMVGGDGNEPYFRKSATLAQPTQTQKLQPHTHKFLHVTISRSAASGPGTDRVHGELRALVTYAMDGPRHFS